MDWQLVWFRESESVFGVVFLIRDVVESIIKKEQDVKAMIERTKREIEEKIRDETSRLEKSRNETISIVRMDAKKMYEKAKLDAIEEKEQMIKAARKKAEQIKIDALYRLDQAVEHIKHRVLGE